METMANKPLLANDYADWFINNIDRAAGALITVSMVHKLVYFAQAWYLANKGRTLFGSGPVSAPEKRVVIHAVHPDPGSILRMRTLRPPPMSIISQTPCSACLSKTAARMTRAR